MAASFGHWIFRMQNLVNKLIMLFFWRRRHEISSYSVCVLLSFVVNSCTLLCFNFIFLLILLDLTFHIFLKPVFMNLDFAFDLVLVNFTVLFENLHTLLSLSIYGLLLKLLINPIVFYQMVWTNTTLPCFLFIQATLVILHFLLMLIL